MKKINEYEKQIKILNNDLKKNEYPEGALIYVLDYNEKNDEIYRIGKTNDLKKRKQIYDTHTLHKKIIVHYKQIENPLKLELCVRSMLYDFRYKDKKDFYVCKLSIIKSAINKCIKEQNKINKEGQIGGGNLLEKIVNKLKKDLIKKNKEIEKINKLLEKNKF